MITSGVHGANLAELVHGPEADGRLDPADDFWEASKLHRDALGWQTPGVQLLAAEPELQRIVQRGYRDYGSRPSVALPAPRQRAVALEDAAAARASAWRLRPEPLGLESLSWLLAVALAPRAAPGTPGARPDLRRVPSAGGLHPTDVWVLPCAVEGLAPATRWYADVRRRRLSDAGPLDLAAVAEASLAPEHVEASSVVLAVSASLWRTRFKYGARGLRFALMESGHVAQALLLGAAALGLAARPLGGFCDDALARCLGLHGVDEVPTYLLCLGGAADDR
jgi:SagB-type dehydrogenase family enzyme